jgi:hypothetical protein
MPLLAFNMASKTFEDITRLVERGLYSGLDQFLEVAALNQLALERGVSPEELKAKDHRSAPLSSLSIQAAPVVRTSVPRPARGGNGPNVRGTPIARRKPTSSTIPPEDSAALKEHTELSRGDGAHPEPLTLKPQHEDDQIFGQVNRVFAMKLVTRWLDTVTTGDTFWPKIDVSGPGITFDAATLGSLLDADDLARGRKREELFATGLPRRGNMPSLDRFQSQYVARVTRNGEIYPGAVCHYALAAFDGDQLGLTSKGVELARLRNPILDGVWDGVQATLSLEERHLLLGHVQEFVPAEKGSFEAVLAAVAGGNNTPEDLLSTVRGVLPDRWSDVMARTHVSGVVARMSELGLLQREWEGRHVRYLPTPAASPFLNTTIEINAEAPDVQ